MEIKVQDVKIGQQVTIASEFSGHFTGVLVRFEECGPLAGPNAVIAVIRQEGGTEVFVKTYKSFPAFVQEEKPAEKILRTTEFPEGFEWDAIGFTEDGWCITAPNGAEMELGTVNDDTEAPEGYSWQVYDTDGAEGGNVIAADGSTEESKARFIVVTFMANNYRPANA